MNWATRFITLTLLTLVWGATPATASFVSSGAQQAGYESIATTVVTVGNIDDPNIVLIDIDVAQLHNPFNVTFQTSGTGADTVAFKVTLSNTSAKPIYQLTIDAFDFGIGTSFVFLPDPAPTPWSQIAPPLNQTLWVGGQFGHSFELLPGGTPTEIYFSAFLSSAFTPSAFTLAFTANPEPETIILASIVCAGFGWMIYRRRKQEAEEQVPGMLMA